MLNVKKNWLRVLLYHQVSDDPAVRHGIQVNAFRRQMEYLARNGYRCLPLPEAVNRFMAGEKFPSGVFALTFDDGFENFLSCVHPVLSRLGFTATIFPVSHLLGRKPNWIASENRLMNAEEIRYLVAKGYTIGSHTRTHKNLSAMVPEQAREELCESRNTLTKVLETEISLLAYPYSAFNDSIIDMSKACGYRAAVVTDERMPGLYHLWRINMDGVNSLPRFIFRWRTFYPMNALKRLVKK